MTNDPNAIDPAALRRLMETYAHHTNPAFSRGFADYMVGRNLAGCLGPDSQAYDRGQECAMRWSQLGGTTR